MVAQDEFKVARGKEDVAAVVDRIQRILARVQQAVDSGRSGFQGQAAVAFQKAVAAWDEEGVRLKKVLMKLEDQVGVGQTTYVNTETENEEGFARVSTAPMTNLV
ncbi:WXG100 family type VII secretion target [Nocardia sp. NBC_00881]|uniref:WXG100 family type VII secretion target n=1 Tax=Nocardia sp. NBC_00881 TaxID=2975995 RepID=UPI00386B968E|nr:WXG100 family type VII secretion target [Nocardia sp. NBC_00881]